MKYAELINHCTWNQHKSFMFLTDEREQLVGVFKPVGNQIHREQKRTPETGAQKPQARPP